MPLHIVRNDITKMPVDAIVNAAKNSLLGGGGVDGQIHAAAGPQLLAECRTLGGCETGDAKITKGYNLPSQFVIHTVGPVWRGGDYGEEKLLRSCYSRSLTVAAENKCETVAFPLISSGIYGYPKDRALRVAVDAIGRWLSVNEDMTVYLVIFDRASYSIGQKLYRDIAGYIDDNYAGRTEKKWGRSRRERFESAHEALAERNYAEDQRADLLAPMPKRFMAAPSVSASKAMPSLDEYIKNTDESFSQMLLRMIDERGMKDSDCYKKANISRKLFSKIRNDVHYRPKKITVLSFAIALELSLEETESFLKSAGYALSHANRTDIIVEYFILKGEYNIFNINRALYAFDQPLLGGV